MKFLIVTLLVIALTLGNVSALSVSLSQSGADSDEIMKGKTFIVEASGWTGSCSQATVSFTGCPSCSLSGENEQKTIGGGASTISWTTTSASQSASAQTVSVSVSSGCTLQNADSSSFDIVLPPSLSLTTTPSTSSLNDEQSYDVNLNLVNNGETTANDISFSLSGTGMSLTSGCSSISSLEEGQSSGQTCTILASSPGSISTTITASSTNADSSSSSFVMTVNSVGSPPQNPGGDSSGTGGSPGGGGPSGENVTKQTRLQAGETLRNHEQFRERIQEMLGYPFDLNELMNNSEKVSKDISLGKDFESTSSQSKLTMSFSYSSSKKAKNMFVYLKVPKDFAEHTDNITISAIGGKIEVLKEDPEYVVLYPEVNPREQLTITLTTEALVGSDIIDEFVSEIYPEYLEEKETYQETFCEPGEKRCFAGDIQECTSDSFWKVLEVCDFGCKEATCLAEGQDDLPEQSFVMELPLDIIAYVGIILLVAIVVVFAFFKHKGKKPSFANIPMMGRSPNDIYLNWSQEV